jgi:hypothetical protein
MREFLGMLLFLGAFALAAVVVTSPLWLPLQLLAWRRRRRLRAALLPLGAVARPGSIACFRLGDREVRLLGTRPWYFEIRDVASDVRSHVFVGPEHGPSQRQALGGGALVRDIFSMFRPRIDDTLPRLAVRSFNADAARALLKHDDVAAAWAALDKVHFGLDAKLASMMPTLPGSVRWASFRGGTLRLLVAGPSIGGKVETELPVVLAHVSTLLEALDRHRAARVHELMRVNAR